MPTIVIETLIHARAEECFDLIRDPRIQTEPPPAIFGEFGVGQTVTFKSKVLGLEQTLTLKVTRLERPILVVDEMTDGPFRFFRHTHEFQFVENGTLVRDTVEWETQLGVFGSLADKLFLQSHLTELVTTRNTKLKELAELKQVS